MRIIVKDQSYDTMNKFQYDFHCSIPFIIFLDRFIKRIIIFINITITVPYSPNKIKLRPLLMGSKST